MALPDILKYVYFNANDDVIRRGKKIFANAGVQIFDNDPLTEYITFRVKNDNYNNTYKVTVQKYGHYHDMQVRCQCPYNVGKVCRHQAAALFQLNELVQSGFFKTGKVAYDQQHTTVRMRQISEYYVRLFSNTANFNKAEQWALAHQVVIDEAKDDIVKATVQTDNNQTFHVTIYQNEERFFDTSCPCNENKSPLCEHKAATFLFILYRYGANYFSTLHNWDTQKNKLLSLYGYSLNDDLTGKFDFSYHEGKPFLRVLDKTIKKVASQTVIKPNDSNNEDTVINDNTNIGLLIQSHYDTIPFIQFNALLGNLSNDQQRLEGTLSQPDIQHLLPKSFLLEKEKNLINALRKLSHSELLRSLKMNLPFGDLMDNVASLLQSNSITKETTQTVWEFYLPKYQQLFEQFTEFPLVYFQNKPDNIEAKNLQACKLSTTLFETVLYVLPNKQSVKIKLQIKLNDEEISLSHFQKLNDALLKKGETIYCAKSFDIITILSLFPTSGEIKISAKKWNEYLESELLPISTLTPIIFDDSFKEEQENVEPVLKLYISETETMLVLKPTFTYHNIEKEWLDFTPVITSKKGKVNIITRNEAVENTFLNQLRYLHESMQESRRSAAFILPLKDALKGDWYFNFRDQLTNANIELIGFDNLKQIKINPQKPKTSFNFSTGLDWFEIEVDVAFGDEQVSIEDIKKALKRKENVVPLKDGTLGLLPSEWIDKYSMPIKLAKVNGNSLRLQKFHFALLEPFTGEMNTAASKEISKLTEKFKLLEDYNFDNTSDIDIPNNIEATLRPYQKGGHQWMKFLQDTQWGGILADDMGLGKTLQTLSILQTYKNHHDKVRFLVVCPTTLIYNWEKEIIKFTPELSYHIFHGSTRSINNVQKNGVDIIITTYGTVRSDIKTLSNIEFDYVILDESQAIKNPLSQSAKACMLLQAKNKLALSGTPIQNNTFDLFSQLNFLNPGMFGSSDFFRDEFAIPIDKMQDAAAQASLRKLIYPFLLRRTKEQVAPDLPEKTETILYCEMGAKQRRVYDAFRNTYRADLLSEIDQKGIERSRFSILTGLMKLRQICDSPAILNEDELYENHSVKIAELARELTENTGKHKALVFSQFLGMLSLIKEELDKHHIPYVYFDGSTTSAEREKAIHQFQEDDDCRVFLISLKAGGVGLNLTAADYVYIVDPWWNPAVEQQAIDRTHRIGQTKNVFAYRLICKDTIEEKIMVLQQKKVNLAKGLIADENAFVKKLTKADVEFLLS